jgi:hypothetical protein
MLTRYVLRMVLIVLTCTSFSYGWQSQPPGASAGNAYPAATPHVVPQQPYQGTPQYSGAPQPLPQYEPAQSGNVTQDAYPQYPYPQYHNPYYSGSGTTARDMLSYTMDWLFCLPSNVADQVSNFVDNRFFPQTPATHGGQPQSQIQRANPSGGNSAPAPQQTTPPPGTAPAASR